VIAILFVLYPVNSKSGFRLPAGIFRAASASTEAPRYGDLKPFPNAFDRAINAETASTRPTRRVLPTNPHPTRQWRLDGAFAPASPWQRR
jgi:hypothetical protein